MSMNGNFQNTAMYQEIQAIMASGQNPIAHTWECTIHANGQDIPALYVNSTENEREYIKHFSDLKSINLTISAGTLHYYVTPYKDNLQITLKKIPLSPALTPTPDTTRAPEAFRYTAHLWDNGSGLLEANTPNLLNKQTADNTQHVSVQFQLLNPVIAQIRATSVTTGFRDMRGIDVVRYLLGKYSQQSTDDMAVMVKGVDVAPGFNTQVRDHIIVQQGTKLFEVPRKVNEQCGGLYPAGFNFYLQGNMWYVYAPFDVTRYQASQNTLTVMNVPANRMPNSEITYRQTATQVILMATGQTKHIDASEQAQLNFGNAIRFVDASKVVKGFGTVQDNKLTVDMAKNVTEVTFAPRPDGVNITYDSPDKITVGNYNQYAALIARSGAFAMVTWENSNPDLLYPGMPVKYMYLQDDTPQELYGVLVGTHTYDLPSNVNPVNKRFTSRTVLTLFISSKILFDALTAANTQGGTTSVQQTIGT